MLAMVHGPAAATVYALFGTLVVAMVTLGTGPIATLRDRTGQPPPEGRPFRGYSADTLEAYLQKAGPDGWALYRRSLLQDVPFFLLYGAGLVLLIDGTLGRLFANPSASLRYGLPAIGAAAALADAFEDLCLWLAVRTDGLTQPSWVRVSSIFTHLKWVLSIAAVAGIGTGALLLPFRGPTSFSPPVTFLQFAHKDPPRITYSTRPSDCQALPGPRPDLSRPDPRCTPGSVDGEVTEATIEDTICGGGSWTQDARPQKTDIAKGYLYHAYGISPDDQSQLDHLIPLELGGSNDITNLWIEVGLVRNNAKDKVENRLNRMVCRDPMSLQAARAAIVANWMTAVEVLRRVQAARD